MINFSKRLEGFDKNSKTNPIEIYDTLDRASDKGPLRPSQYAILDEWYSERKEERDHIIKLHTGQGKTLIGLLILQSRLNENSKSAVYVCPNIFLAKQTCLQAEQFGIPFCVIGADKSLPQEFLNGEKILITYAQKIFNGFTKFGLKNKAIPVDSIVLDDSHSCIETIDDSFTVRLYKDIDKMAFEEILEILGSLIEDQGYAKLQEIIEGDANQYISVPYWIWKENFKRITQVLAVNKDVDKSNYKFAWELVKDRIEDCYCYISGNIIEIRPYMNQIDKYGSFFKANCRVFMSATTNNDSFFIKGLGLNKKTILNPIIHKDNKWSGEKMILLPYHIDENLNRQELIEYYAPKDAKRKFGVVVLTSGYYRTKNWVSGGATLINSDNINDKVNDLLAGNYFESLVFANRYDGIDLPDSSCRILIIDSKPSSETLHDKYQEEVRSNSDIIDIKIAQKLEQGLGRGVRGEKDYCVILLTGADILNVVVNERYRKFFSEQTQEQIRIGLDITKYAVEDATSEDGLKVLNETIHQCLKRDESWKSYYQHRMDTIKSVEKDPKILDILELEKIAEEAYNLSDFGKAQKIIQKIIDEYIENDNLTEKGWYLQQIARYLYNDNNESNKFQVIAHKNNKYLYKPSSGMDVSKLLINQGRVEKIQIWINKFENYNDLKFKLESVLGNLTFGSEAELFEQSLEQVGHIIGFESERPEKYWKAGPDNLWCLAPNKYILFECKNEVAATRAEIYKKETGQMLNSCAWFDKQYVKTELLPIMIINTRKCAHDAALDSRVVIMKKHKLNQLSSSIRNFYKEFNTVDLKTATSSQITRLLEKHKLSERYFFDGSYFDKVV